MKGDNYMLKNHSKLTIFSSLFTILPIFIGLFLWSRLPDQVAIHFSTNGADGWASKSFTVFALPFILLATHLLSIFLSSLDPKCKDIKGSPLYLIFLCVPIISNITMFFLYLNALNIKIDTLVFSNAIMGSFFLLISLVGLSTIYPPNHTIGIRLPWTVNNEVVWYKTHKFASVLWSIGGVVFLINIFIKSIILITITFIIIILTPIIYSYIISKNSH